jgi:thiamine pyrophosphokinase
VENLRDKLNVTGVSLQTHNLACDKDASDFAVALDLIAANYPSNHQIVLDLYGACGGRFDHALINFQEVANWVANSRCGVSVIADFGVITNQPVSVFLADGAVFSVTKYSNFPSDETVHVSGARYHGEIRLSRPSSGLSNVVERSPITFFPSAGAAILLWNLAEQITSTCR